MQLLFLREQWIRKKNDDMVKNKKITYSKTLPDEMSIKEASNFWDSHSFFEFDDVQEVKFDVDIEGKKNYVLLDKEIAEKVEDISRKRKLSQHVLVNRLLKKSLEQFVS